MEAARARDERVAPRLIRHPLERGRYLACDQFYVASIFIRRIYAAKGKGREEGARDSTARIRPRPAPIVLLIIVTALLRSMT